MSDVDPSLEHVLEGFKEQHCSRARAKMSDLEPFKVFLSTVLKLSKRSSARELDEDE